LNPSGRLLTASLEINDSLRLRISSQLRRFDVRRIQSAGRKQAAVAVTVVSRLVDANIGDIQFTAFPSVN